jgi:SAM-dependent methyltransferase
LSTQSEANRKAWNFRAYEYWNRSNGSPASYAARLLESPGANINSRYQDIFVDVKGKRILNALGSNGRKAVPLCLLGAEVTIIDISEESQRYAQELAEYAGVTLQYVVADLVTYQNDGFTGFFDIVFAEGGILHYFGDLDALFAKLAIYLRKQGELVLNDFHPYRKILFPEIGTKGNYFDTGLHEGPVAYENQFEDLERKNFPQCLLRFYTVGEIVTSIAKSGLCIREMREIPKVGTESVPGEFTIIARKI